MYIKFFLIFSFTLSLNSLLAQTTVGASLNIFNNTKFQIEQINNTNLKGSLLTPTESSGGSVSLTTLKYFDSKIGLKMKLSGGSFTKSIVYYASPEFINFSNINDFDKRNLFQRPARFVSLVVGANYPINLYKNHYLNVSIGLTASHVTNPFLNRGMEVRNAFYFDNEGSQQLLQFLVGEEISTPGDIQLGTEGELIYEFKSPSTPFGFEIGIVGSLSFDPYFTGMIYFVGLEETAEFKVSANSSYYALRCGFTYTFQPFEY